MKVNIKKIIVVLCLLMSLVLFLFVAGCAQKEGNGNNENTKSTSSPTSTTNETTESISSSEPTTSVKVPEEPLKFTVLVDAINWTKNNLDINDSEEKKIWDSISNTEITFITPPHAEISEKANIIMASGDMPDVLVFGRQPMWVDAGYIKPLDEYIQKYGDMGIQTEAYLPFIISGKLYGIPILSELHTKNGFIMRKDWLDNLGLDMPETLDEYRDVLIAFTKNDPDKNGKDDTFGATFRSGFTYMDGFRGAFDLVYMVNIPYELKDGKLIPQVIQPKYKEYLAFMNNLWENGVFTPNAFVNTADQWKKEIFTGEAGAWFHDITRIDEYFMTNFNTTLGENNGVVLCAPIPPKGPYGQGITSSFPAVSSVQITTSAKEPERIFQYIMWTKTSPEAKDFAKYGIEGKQHKLVDGKKEWLPDVIKNMNVFQTKELVYFYQPAKIDDETTKFLYGERAVEAHEQNVKYSTPPYTLLLGKPLLQAETDYPDVEKVLQEYTIKIISGELSLDSFDDMIKALNNAGLQKRTDEIQQWYDENKK